MEDLKENFKEKAEKVKEGVKETLLGVEDELQTSDQTRAEFMKYAKKDEGSEEWYMGESEFIDAVAPAGEDYVSSFITTALESVQCRPWLAHALWCRGAAER